MSDHKFEPGIPRDRCAACGKSFSVHEDGQEVLNEKRRMPPSIVTQGDGIKLFFRFKGVPLDRPGGAFWERTFYAQTRPPYKNAHVLRAELLDTLRPFLAAYAFDSLDVIVEL